MSWGQVVYNSCRPTYLFQEACILAVLWHAEELGHSFERVCSDEHLAPVFLRDSYNGQKDEYLESILLHDVNMKSFAPIFGVNDAAGGDANVRAVRICMTGNPTLD